MPEGSGRPAAPMDDQVQPFMLEATGFRGRLLRLGPALDRIVTRHDYPRPVAAVLAEMLALAALVSSLLKHDGIFTLQAQGSGPLGLLVADVTHEGKLRGYAQFDRARLEGEDFAGSASVPELFGEGYLVYTLDQGGKGERYQGIVELKGETLADSMQHYFRQSDQVNAGLKLASARFEDGWRAAALLVQQLPEEEGGTLDSPGNAVEDDWRRALILMSSCTDEELLDAELPPRDLLYRLFHEEGVRVFEPQDYLDGCRCARERIETTLRSMPRDEVESLKVDNALIVTCQFCNREYRFEEADIEAIYPV